MHVLTRGGARSPVEEDRQCGVVVHRVREPEFPKDPSAFVRWVESMNADMGELADELLERLDFDLVHSHDWPTPANWDGADYPLHLAWKRSSCFSLFSQHITSPKCPNLIEV